MTPEERYDRIDRQLEFIASQTADLLEATRRNSELAERNSEQIARLSERAGRHDEHLAQHDEHLAQHDEQIARLDSVMLVFGENLGRLVDLQSELTASMTRLSESQVRTDERLVLLIDRWNDRFPPSPS